MITHKENVTSVADSTLKMQNMRLRLSSACIIGSIFITSILFSFPPFTAVMMIIGMVMVFEWYHITSSAKSYLFLGPIIIFPSIIALILLHNATHKWLVLTYFVMIWTVDTLGMIAGKAIGGPKLAKSLSPNKTWSGFICASFTGSIVFLVMYYCFVKDRLDPSLLFTRHIIVFAIGMSIIAQISDLFISYFKRKFNFKDSGNIIPGHGGMLDRFDSIILTAPILYLAMHYIY